MLKGEYLGLAQIFLVLQAKHVFCWAMDNNRIICRGKLSVFWVLLIPCLPTSHLLSIFSLSANAVSVSVEGLSKTDSLTRVLFDHRNQQEMGICF